MPISTQTMQTVGVTTLPALSSGTNVIGHVVVDSAGAVSITSLPTLPSGSNVIGHVIVDNSGTKLLDAAGTNLGKVGTAGDLLVSVTNPNAALAGIYATVNVFGSQNVSIDPSIWFGDTFEGSVVDVTNRWTSAGTVPPTQATGLLSVNPGSTANATSVLSTQPTFPALTSAVAATTITFESGTTALGNHRFFGFGTASGVGTAAAPLQDAIGFEVDVSGVLRASVYASGSRVFTQSLTMSTDGLPHRYVVIVRGDIAFWFKDTFDIPLASSSLGTAAQTLPMRYASLNSASVTGTPTLVATGAVVIDQARNAQGIADGTYPWRRALVDASGNIAIKGGYAEQSGLIASALNADLVASTDVSAYKWWSLHYTAVATGGVLTFQGSNDNINFVTIQSYPISSSAAPTTTQNAVGIYYGICSFRYIRVRQTSWTSGSSTGVLELYTATADYPTTTGPVSQSGTWTVMPGNTVNTSPWFANSVGTTGGTTSFHLISAATTNATAVKASAGQVYGYDIYNSNAAARFVKLYNKATAPTVGTDTPVRTIGIPAAGRASETFSNGINFATGIGLATTTGITDADTGTVTLSDLAINLDYK